MLDYLIGLCTSEAGLRALVVGADLLIALAYFSIPLSMLWVFRNRKVDLPYPGLWISFVAFIAACGLTHFLHFAAAGLNTPMLELRTGVHLATAVISVTTAVALSLVLPQVSLLPSPRQQREQLERAVDLATRDKDALLLELHHRVGNQLAKMGAVVRREIRQAEPSNLEALRRIEDLLEELGEEHHRLSLQDYTAQRGPGNFTLRKAVGQP